VAVDDLKSAVTRSWVIVVTRDRGGANGALRFGGSCLVAGGKRGEDGTDSGDTKNEGREMLRRHGRLQKGESAMYGTWVS